MVTVSVKVTLLKTTVVEGEANCDTPMSAAGRMLVTTEDALLAGLESVEVDVTVAVLVIVAAEFGLLTMVIPTLAPAFTLLRLHVTVPAL